MSSYTPLKPGFKRSFLKALRLHPNKGGYLQVGDALTGKFYGDSPDDVHGSYVTTADDDDEGANILYGDLILKDPSLASITDADAFCCLGVGCNILMVQNRAPYGWEDEVPEDDLASDGKGGWNDAEVGRTLAACGMPPKSFCDKMGMSSEVASKLAAMNDEGKSFEEIADWIEKNL